MKIIIDDGDFIAKDSKGYFLENVKTGNRVRGTKKELEKAYNEAMAEKNAKILASMTPLDREEREAVLEGFV